MRKGTEGERREKLTQYKNEVVWLSLPFPLSEFTPQCFVFIVQPSSHKAVKAG